MQRLGEREIFSIQELNSLAKEMLEQFSFWVTGEVYDFKNAERRYYYVYFSLKDGDYLLPCIMLPQVFDALPTPLENGQKVLARGKLTVFTKSGKLQFSIEELEVAGEGKLAKELELLKSKLQAEGLLDQARKRPLPEFPQKIGVITSADSDAWADFQRHSAAKFPLMELILADSFVQGRRAVASLLRAISVMQKQDIEVLVMIRGGGSLEDLAAFNDEQVVRALAASRMPTLVGVGHEKDISVADLVADVRASTPTNAGQILTKNYEAAAVDLVHHSEGLRRMSRRMIESSAMQLDQAALKLQQVTMRYQNLPLTLQQYGLKLQQAQQQLVKQPLAELELLQQKLSQVGRFMMSRNQDRVTSVYRQLQAVSPESVLARGYSLVMVEGRIIRASQQVRQGDTMQIRLARGSLRGLITRVEDKD